MPMEICKKLKKWIPAPNVAAVYDLDTIRWRSEGLAFTLIPDGHDAAQKEQHRLELIFQQILGYQATSETYRQGLWIDAPKDAWTFFECENSPWVKHFREISDLCPEIVHHYVLRGSNWIVEILAEDRPKVIMKVD